MQAAAFLQGEKRNTQVSISFGEKMDRAALRQAWEMVCARHDILRSSFTRSMSGEVTVHVADSCETVWRELDWQALKPQEIPARWAEAQAADASEAFDALTLVRLTEILLPGGGAHHLLTVPQFLLDEPSVVRVLLDWLIALERPLPVAEPSQPASASPSAWALPESEPLVLHPRPAGHDSASLKIGREETARFLAACKAMDPGVVIESLWTLTLRRLGATGNVSLRRFDARRSPHDVGYFENWLPVAHSWGTNWLSEACARHETAAANAWISPASALAAGQVSGLQTGFRWSGPEINDIVQTALPRWINFDARISQSRPDLLLLEARPGLSLEVHGPLGRKPAARELLARLAGLIEAFGSFEAKPPDQIPLLVPQEIRRIKEWSRGPEPAEHPANALEAFRGIVEKFPDGVAVRDGDYELTYRELDVLSDRLAAHLAHVSLAGGWHVALFLSPSSWIAIALIGSWKAGNACLALDPSAPPEWIESMLSSHDAGLVLCDAASAPLLDTSTRHRIILDQEWDALEVAEPAGLPDPACGPDSPAAILPGHADGIAPIIRALTHEMVTAAAREGAHLLEFHPGDSFLAHSAAGSGAFFDEWLIPLLSGGIVRIAEDDLLDPVHSMATHVRMTAPEWNNQAARWTRGEETFESPLRVVAVEMGTASKLSLGVWNHCTGGQVKTVAFFSAPGLCGLGIAGAATPDGPLLVVGKPVPGTEAAIADADSHDLPPGFSGQLWMKFPGWKSLSNNRGRRGIETGLRGWRTPDGDIRLEGSAAPGLDCPDRVADLLSGKNVLDAFEGDHLWVLPHCEGAIAVAEWPLTRGGWIDPSLLPKPQSPPQAPEPPKPQTPAARVKVTIPWVPVSVLQPEGSDPLVLVPCASGVPETYRDLIAALGNKRRLLGLTARGAAHAPHATIESAAAAWIDALLEEDPTLSFDLCGFGFGAIAALEMARQLATAKRPVPDLILIGAPAPQTDAAPGWLASMKKAFKHLDAPGRVEPFTAIGEPTHTHEAAWNRYRFVPCDIPARIILPSDFPPEAGSAWLDLLPSANVEQVKCTWPEMLAFPAVKRLATIIGS